MCITFFKLDPTSPTFPLILAFNRDEVTYRLSKPAGFHFSPSIICGIDIQTNSTWLAFNKATGDLCFLTNFRTPSNYNQQKRYGSRGFLVSDFVRINDPDIPISEKRYTNVEDYERALIMVDTRGFNIVYGNVKEGWIKYYQYQNRVNGTLAMISPEKLEVGRTYGLTNGSLNEWDKT
jgi:uncharacterized protein with NRDE domain